jgi:AcrR family transcriptional regulator
MDSDLLPAPSRADIRRQRVLDAARALFIERGFHQTGVALIEEVSGVKVAQIYRDFGSKEDIIAAISRVDVTDWLEKGIASAVAGGDRHAIHTWIGRFVSLELTIGQCRILTEIAAEAGRNERIAEVFREIDSRARKCLAEALAALAPGANRAAGRARLLDLILMLGLGFAVRRTIGGEIDIAKHSKHASEIVGRELDRLRA